MELQKYLTKLDQITHLHGVCLTALSLEHREVFEAIWNSQSTVDEKTKASKALHNFLKTSLRCLSDMSLQAMRGDAPGL